jgi:hypothetical protein
VLVLAKSHGTPMVQDGSVKLATGAALAGGGVMSLFPLHA